MSKNLMSLYNRFQQIHVLLDDGDRRALGELGLSSTQYNLLWHLGNCPDGLTITELSNLLICTRSNATRLVQRLGERDLVQTHRNQKDRRLVYVTLSEAGQNALKEAQIIHDRSVKNRLGALTTEDLHILENLTGEVVTVLEKHLAIEN